MLAVLVPVAAGEVGGRGRVVDPVGGGQELLSRFAMPVTETVLCDGSGVPWVVWVTPTDRRAGAQPLTGVGMRPGAQAPGSGSVSQPRSGSGGLEMLLGVGLEVSVELGRTRVTLAEVLDFDVGSTIELDRAVGAPVDVRVNDTLLAQGEVVLVDDEYAVRITAIFDPGQPPT